MPECGELLLDGGGHLWTDIHLFVDLIMRRDRGAILQPEAFKLIMVTNTSRSLVRIETTLVDVMKTLHYCTRAFLLQYNISPMDVRMKDSAETTVSSGFFLRRGCQKYIWFVRSVTC